MVHLGGCGDIRFEIVPRESGDHWIKVVQGSLPHPFGTNCGR